MRTAVCCGLICAAALAAPTPAAARFITGQSGPEYTSTDSSERGHWFDETVAAHASIVRINVLWSATVSREPLDATNPADPAYDFSALDDAVRDAAARDIDLLLTLYDAPAFAEAPGRDSSAPAGSWKPDPDQYAAFAKAVATRYSGSYLGLPRVRYYQAWNEPDLSLYLTPQWEGTRPFAASHYRQMLNAFDAAVHGVRTDNLVVTAGTAPFGDPPGGSRTRPLRFWRDVLCLKQEHGKLKGKSCPEKAHFDILAHHPIQTSGGPRRSAINPDDVTTPDFKHVVETLRRAEKLNKVSGGRHPLWATEIWWQSDPPDSMFGVPLQKHAAWSQESLYLLWKQGADAVINLSIRDPETDPGHPEARIEAGLFFHDGSPKPAFAAWRFPFVVDASAKQALAWGKAPASGELKIQRRRTGSWQTVASLTTAADRVFTRRLHARPGQVLRAVVGDEVSLNWRVHR
jgi:hypothetical protein